MTFIKTTLASAIILTASTGIASADGHAGGATVISESLVLPEVGPSTVTMVVFGGLLALASTASASSSSD